MICQCLAGSIICRSQRPQQIIDLLTTDQSQYFAQPPLILIILLIVIKECKNNNYLPHHLF